MPSNKTDKYSKQSANTELFYNKIKRFHFQPLRDREKKLSEILLRHFNGDDTYSHIPVFVLYETLFPTSDTSNLPKRMLYDRISIGQLLLSQACSIHEEIINLSKKRNPN